MKLDLSSNEALAKSTADMLAKLNGVTPPDQAITDDPNRGINPYTQEYQTFNNSLYDTISKSITTSNLNQDQQKAAVEAYNLTGQKITDGDQLTRLSQIYQDVDSLHPKDEGYVKTTDGKGVTMPEIRQALAGYENKYNAGAWIASDQTTLNAKRDAVHAAVEALKLPKNMYKIDDQANLQVFNSKTRVFEPINASFADAFYANKGAILTDIGVSLAFTAATGGVGAPVAGALLTNRIKNVLKLVTVGAISDSVVGFNIDNAINTGEIASLTQTLDRAREQALLGLGVFGAIGAGRIAYNNRHLPVKALSYLPGAQALGLVKNVATEGKGFVSAKAKEQLELMIGNDLSTTAYRNAAWDEVVSTAAKNMPDLKNMSELEQRFMIAANTATTDDIGKILSNSPYSPAIKDALIRMQAQVDTQIGELRDSTMAIIGHTSDQNKIYHTANSKIQDLTSFISNTKQALTNDMQDVIVTIDNQDFKLYKDLFNTGKFTPNSLNEYKISSQNIATAIQTNIGKTAPLNSSLLKYLNTGNIDSQGVIGLRAVDVINVLDDVQSMLKYAEPRVTKAFGNTGYIITDEAIKQLKTLETNILKGLNDFSTDVKNVNLAAKFNSYKQTLEIANGFKRDLENAISNITINKSTDLNIIQKMVGNGQFPSEAQLDRLATALDYANSISTTNKLQVSGREFLELSITDAIINKNINVTNKEFAKYNLPAIAAQLADYSSIFKTNRGKAFKAAFDELGVYFRNYDIGRSISYSSSKTPGGVLGAGTLATSVAGRLKQIRVALLFRNLAKFLPTTGNVNNKIAESAARALANPLDLKIREAFDRELALAVKNKEMTVEEANDLAKQIAAASNEVIQAQNNIGPDVQAYEASRQELIAKKFQELGRQKGYQGQLSPEEHQALLKEAEEAVDLDYSRATELPTENTYSPYGRVSPVEAAVLTKQSEGATAQELNEAIISGVSEKLKTDINLTPEAAITDILDSVSSTGGTMPSKSKEELIKEVSDTVKASGIDIENRQPMPISKQKATGSDAAPTENDIDGPQNIYHSLLTSDVLAKIPEGISNPVKLQENITARQVKRDSFNRGDLAFIDKATGGNHKETYKSFFSPDYAGEKEFSEISKTPLLNMNIDIAALQADGGLNNVPQAYKTYMTSLKKLDTNGMIKLVNQLDIGQSSKHQLEGLLRKNPENAEELIDQVLGPLPTSSVDTDINAIIPAFTNNIGFINRLKLKHIADNRGFDRDVLAADALNPNLPFEKQISKYIDASPNAKKVLDYVVGFDPATQMALAKILHISPNLGPYLFNQGVIPAEAIATLMDKVKLNGKPVSNVSELMLAVENSDIGNKSEVIKGVQDAFAFLQAEFSDNLTAVANIYSGSVPVDKFDKFTPMTKATNTGAKLEDTEPAEWFSPRALPDRGDTYNLSDIKEPHTVGKLDKDFDLIQNSEVIFAKKNWDIPELRLTTPVTNDDAELLNKLDDMLQGPIIKTKTGQYRDRSKSMLSYINAVRYSPSLSAENKLGKLYDVKNYLARAHSLLNIYNHKGVSQLQLNLQSGIAQTNKYLSDLSFEDQIVKSNIPSDGSFTQDLNLDFARHPFSEGDNTVKQKMVNNALVVNAIVERYKTNSLINNQIPTKEHTIKELNLLKNQEKNYNLDFSIPQEAHYLQSVIEDIETGKIDRELITQTAKLLKSKPDRKQDILLDFAGIVKDGRIQNGLEAYKLLEQGAYDKAISLYGDNPIVKTPNLDSFINNAPFVDLTSIAKKSDNLITTGIDVVANKNDFISQSLTPKASPGINKLKAEVQKNLGVTGSIDGLRDAVKNLKEASIKEYEKLYSRLKPYERRLIDNL